MSWVVLNEGKTSEILENLVADRWFVREGDGEKPWGLYIIDGKLGSYSDAEYRQIKKQLLGGSKKTEAETLRDKFAMAAVQGILDGSARSHRDYEDIAIDSYVLADLMLKARKKRV